eukprot:362107-Chlamydomonas_euryale.AAC.11
MNVRAPTVMRHPRTCMHSPGGTCASVAAGPATTVPKHPWAKPNTRSPTARRRPQAPSTPPPPYVPLSPPPLMLLLLLLRAAPSALTTPAQSEPGGPGSPGYLRVCVRVC